ncbi:hypothetical protein D3C72_1883440 [compost metagenome]
MIQMRMRGRVGGRALRADHLFVAAADHDEIGLGAPDGRQPGRLGLQQGTHFQQVVQGARLRVEQVHQRPGVHLRNMRDERPLALRGMDDLPRPQQLEPFAQRRARHAQLFGQAPLGRQGLAGLEHAVQDQALDPLGHFIGHLAWFLFCFRVHAISVPVV